ncbi:sensor histidine kinase [Terriglobus sp.]|uniref:sensor histidine kinase n=1 Tax=Terriglobus sp. TaxID=1889013 RepID=UPI003B0009DD
MNSRRTLASTRWILAAAALGGIVLLYRRWVHVNQTTVALTLLLLVLVLAAEWGLRYALVISVAAAASYNFFFLPPFDTFVIADTQNWLALLAFLSTAVIASRLSQRVRNRADDAKARQRELDLLFRLSRELLQTESVAALVSSLPGMVVDITGAASGYLYLLEGDRLYQSGGAKVLEIEMPHLAKLTQELSNVQRAGEELQMPLRSGVRPKGLFVLRSAAVSIETASAMAGLISLAQDRAQALENLARGEAAKESERLRTLMIDSITHELRTPLTSIKGAATTLLTGAIDEDGTRELLSIVDEEADHLNRLVTEAVEMAQLDSQQVQLNRRTVLLQDLVAEAIRDCANSKARDSVRTSIPAELTVNADPALLQKVLCNLLGNALKYSKPGTPVTISAESLRSHVRVSVADQGIGIDASEQPLIFERYYRGRSNQDATQGTGMGLAISRAIVQAHHGDLDVVSQPDRGSVFSFQLPMGRGDISGPATD